MTIKLTTTQRDNFKGELRFVSNFTESEDNYLKGKAESAEAFPYLFKSDSCDIDTEYTEIRWQTIKNFVQKNITWYADLVNKAKSAGQDGKRDLFSGKKRAYEWLLNVMNTIEKGEDLPDWSM